MSTAKTPLTSAEKIQRRLRRRKSAARVFVVIFDVLIAICLVLMIAISWSPMFLSISLGAIGVSFASAVRAITILDFMLGTSVLLFETTLWVFFYIKVMKLIHKGLTAFSHKVILVSMQKGGKK